MCAIAFQSIGTGEMLTIPDTCRLTKSGGNVPTQYYLDDNLYPYVEYSVMETRQHASVWNI